jgi:hypothetical protein
MKIKTIDQMYYCDGCQLPSVAKIGLQPVKDPFVSVIISLKRRLAYPWNQFVKKFLKKSYRASLRFRKTPENQLAAKDLRNDPPLKKGDKVRVRSLEEIDSTLDRFRELKGCAFLLQMQQYCGTEQRVFKIMERFLDERDYKVKKTRGLILLENNFCNGTPVFGACDRSCFLFWREEWLEKIDD